MPFVHVIFIPLTILVGVGIGFFLGSRATRGAMVAEQKREAERAAARAARAARDAGAPPKA